MAHLIALDYDPYCSFSENTARVEHIRATWNDETHRESAGVFYQSVVVNMPGVSSRIKQMQYGMQPETRNGRRRPNLERTESVQ